MNSLHLLFISLFVISNLFVIISRNPVHSVLFLILSFCHAAAILFLFNAEFLGLIFIIIYVGAIAVLFLFVIMMLNIKITYFDNYLKVPFFLLFGFFLMIQIFLMMEKIFKTSDNLIFNSIFFIDNISSINAIGQSLYNNYLICFLLAGFILLVAMIGAIALTLNFRSERKNELVLRQLSRSDNFLSFLK